VSSNRLRKASDDGLSMARFDSCLKAFLKCAQATRKTEENGLARDQGVLTSRK